MLCPRCGNSNKDDSKFCTSCGAALNEVSTLSFSQDAGLQSNNTVNMRYNVRSSEMNEVDRMINYFSQKNDLYAEYESLCARLDPRFKKKKVGLLVLGIIAGIIGFYVAVFGISLKSAGTIGFGVLMIAGGAVMIFGFIRSSSARNENYSKTYSRFDEVSNELYNHYLNYGPCLVSAQYTNPSNLRIILDTIRSGRADTIKEAVNILVEDAHRNNMEAIARENAIASANAARGAAAAAVFSAANLFIKR